MVFHAPPKAHMCQIIRAQSWEVAFQPPHGLFPTEKTLADLVSIPWCININSKLLEFAVCRYFGYSIIRLAEV